MGNYKGIPMKDKHIELIEQGKKRTTLRDLRYGNYLFEHRIITVPDDLTPQIAEWEGYPTTQELVEELERLGHRLPKRMYLYFLDKPIKGVSDT